MPPTSFASEGVRVVVPRSYDVREASRARALPGEPGFEQQVAKDAIVASLEDSGLVTMQRLDLSPRRDRGLPGAAPGRPSRAMAMVEVDVGSEEDAVVLLERDGVYSWHLPVDAGHRTRSIDLGPRTARFTIDLVEDGRASGRTRPARHPVRTRGLLGDIVQGRGPGHRLPVRCTSRRRQGDREDGGACPSRVGAHHRHRSRLLATDRPTR